MECKYCTPADGSRYGQESLRKDSFIDARLDLCGAAIEIKTVPANKEKSVGTLNDVIIKYCPMCGKYIGGI